MLYVNLPLLFRVVAEVSSGLEPQGEHDPPQRDLGVLLSAWCSFWSCSLGRGIVLGETAMSKAAASFKGVLSTQ